MKQFQQRGWWAAPVAAVALLATAGSGQAEVDLTGTWHNKDGAIFSVRQIDNGVWWVGRSADHGKSWTHVFHGKVDGDKLTGRYVNVPAGKAVGEGTLEFTLVRKGDRVFALRRPDDVLRRGRPRKD
jgi:hypothetical protein